MSIINICAQLLWQLSGGVNWFLFWRLPLLGGISREQSWLEAKIKIIRTEWHQFAIPENQGDEPANATSLQMSSAPSGVSHIPVLRTKSKVDPEGKDDNDC